VFKGELLSLATISKVDFGFVVFIPICEKMEKLFKKITKKNICIGVFIKNEFFAKV